MGRFCIRCGVLNSHPNSGYEQATRWRRLAGDLIDGLLIGVLALVSVALWPTDLDRFLILQLLGLAGWSALLYMTAPDGQSPGKRLVGLTIVRENGEPISPARVMVRDILVKRVLFLAIGAVLGFLPLLVDALWILWDRDRQTLHDKMMGTLVVATIRAGAVVPRAAPTERPEPQGGVDPGFEEPPQQPLPPPPMERPRNDPTPSVPRGVEAFRGGADRRTDRERRRRDLDDLWEKGLITKREYDTRKRDLES